MHKTQHTPAPWKWNKVYLENSSSPHPVATLLETKARPVPWNDPVIFALREDWLGELSAEREAAKRLIVSAPEMFKALQLVVEYHVTGINPLSDAAVLSARAAIAKANGEGE